MTNRACWREALEDGSYDPQDKELAADCRDGAVTNGDGECDQLVVKDMSRALLQLLRAVEPKYLCKPLGKPITFSGSQYRYLPVKSQTISR